MYNIAAITSHAAARTYKDAPARPAVVPLEPGQQVTKESQALQAQG